LAEVEISYWSFIMKKIIFILFLIIFICFFIILDSLSLINTTARVLGCVNNLKDIWQYIEQYKVDWDGSLPQSLSQLDFYGDLPRCPGDREKDETSRSWDYCYLAPSDKGIKPLCWDSETHHYKIKKPYKRNVLFTDGHIESLDEKDFFRLMQKYGISDPNNTFSKYIPPSNISKEIEPVPHQGLLDILEKTDISEIEKLREIFYKYPIQQQLETIAYTLSKGIYSDKTVRLMTGNRDLLNTGFAKYFPKNIRNLEGRPLYDAVNIINTVFPKDPTFIPVLLDYAIESDYIPSYKTSTHSGHEPLISSFFEIISHTLYKLSNKKIGTLYYPGSQYQDRGKREEVIKQWRDIYEKSIKPDLIKKGIISE
jgi:prepilin-type processing-associated H-X9-DG protein